MQIGGSILSFTICSKRRGSNLGQTIEDEGIAIGETREKVGIISFGNIHSKILSCPKSFDIGDQAGIGAQLFYIGG